MGILSRVTQLALAAVFGLAVSTLSSAFAVETTAVDDLPRSVRIFILYLLLPRGCRDAVGRGRKHHLHHALVRDGHVRGHPAGKGGGPPLGRGGRGLHRYIDYFVTTG